VPIQLSRPTNTKSSIMPISPRIMPTTLSNNLTACEHGSNPDTTSPPFRLAPLLLQDANIRHIERSFLTAEATQTTVTTQGKRDALRRRRMLPREHFNRNAPNTTLPPTSIWVTPSLQTDDVVSERIQAWRFRSDNDLADAFAALSNMSRPEEHVTALAEKLYEASTDASLTSEQRDIFKTTGATFDLLSIFAPHVWIMKTAETAGGIVAKALRNETISPQDILDINGAFKGVVDQGVQNAIAHQNTVWRTMDQTKAYKPGILKEPRNSDLITQLYFQKTFGAAKKEKPKTLLRENQRGSFTKLSPARPSLSGESPAPAVSVTHDEVVISLDAHAVRTAPASQTIALQKAPPAQPSASASLSETKAVLPDIVDSAANDAGEEESAEFSDSADGELSEAADKISMKVRSALIAGETLPERHWSDVGTATLALRDRARAAALRRKAQIKIDIANKVPPPLSYASSDGIRLLLQADETGRVAWRILPNVWYRAAVAVPENQIGVFTIGVTRVCVH